VPTLTFTARNIPRLGPIGTARGEYYDESLPGFGLRVTPGGIKSWTLRYHHDGRLHRMTLGRYPNISLADARESARKHLRRAGLGQHPAGEKLDARERQVDTIAALITAYEALASRRKGWPEERRILNAEILPVWRNRLVSGISRRDVRALVDDKALTAPVMANRLLAEISRLFNFALDREWISANPAHRMRKPTTERSRDRVLSSNELNELWTALHQTEATDGEGKRLPRLSPTLNAALRMMLLTAQRSGEVCGMRWQDIDLDSGWWTLPGAATKNGSDHRVPLTDAVVESLAARLQTATPETAYVFSTRRGTSVAVGAKKAASELSRGLSFAFRAHDLRRTAASGMAESGIPREHIAHVLNHRSVTRSTVTAIYDRFNYAPQKRHAVETWARRLALAVADDSQPSAPVVSITTHRRLQ